jgi:hypothetical protein
MQSSQNCNSDEGNNTWEAVAALIGLDLEDQVVVSSSSSSKKLQDVKIAELLNSKLGTDPNSPIGIIMAARDLDGRRLKDPPPTPSKATDLSRFKEVNSWFSFFFSPIINTTAISLSYLVHNFSCIWCDFYIEDLIYHAHAFGQTCNFYIEDLIHFTW